MSMLGKAREMGRNVYDKVMPVNGDGKRSLSPQARRIGLMSLAGGVTLAGMGEHMRRTYDSHKQQLGRRPTLSETAAHFYNTYGTSEGWKNLTQSARRRGHEMLTSMHGMIRNSADGLMPPEPTAPMSPPQPQQSRFASWLDRHQFYET